MRLGPSLPCRDPLSAHERLPLATADLTLLNQAFILENADLLLLKVTLTLTNAALVLLTGGVTEERAGLGACSAPGP